MKCIAFSFTSLKSLLPIFAGITYGMRTYHFSSYEPSLLFKMFLMEIGMMLAIFLEFISLYRQGRNKDLGPNEFSNAFEKYKSHPKIVLLIILGIGMDLLGFFFNLLLTVNDNSINQHLLSITRITEFFFVGILYYYFFKLTLHRHHYVALILVLFGTSLMLLSQGVKVKAALLFAIIGNLIYASLEILEKWIMDFKFFSPLEVVGVQGIVGIFITFGICYGCSLMKCEQWYRICSNPTNSDNVYILDLNANINGIYENTPSILYVITYILLSTMYNVFNLSTIKHLGPTHRIICDVFSPTVTFIASMIMESKKINPFTQVIGIIITSIGLMIYNEHLILYIFNLDEYTSESIRERAIDKGFRFFSVKKVEGKYELDNKLLQGNPNILGINEE